MEMARIPRRWALPVGLVACASVTDLARTGFAQGITVTAPRSVVVTNYDRTPIGQREGIEAGAFVARTNDAGAGWYNPAGLAQSRKSAFNASASAYEWTRLTLAGLGDTASRSKISGIGTYVGAVIGAPPLHSDKWRLGASVTRPITWNPSQVDVAFNPPSSGKEELFRYAWDVDLSTIIPAVSVGYAAHGIGKSPLRLGAALSWSHTSLDQNLTVSDRVTTPTAATTQLRSFVGGGSANTLILTGGLQWDLAARATVGLRIASAGIPITHGGNLVLEGSDFSGSAAADATFRDDEARFDYKFPVKADAGIVVRFARGEAEADVRYYGPISRYVLYGSDSLATVRRVSGNEPPVLSSAPYTTTYNAARSVTNVAIGGNYRITSALTWHGGFAADASPVESQDESIFIHTDLYHVTSGLTFGWTSLSGSFGLSYGWGAGGLHSIGNTSSAEPIETRLRVRTINLVYAFSYAFGGRPGQ